MTNETETTTQNDRAHIAYKDIPTLGNYVNPHARMYNRRRSGFSARQQRDFARATKRARFMALMPYVTH